MIIELVNITPITFEPNKQNPFLWMTESDVFVSSVRLHG